MHNICAASISQVQINKTFFKTVLKKSPLEIHSVTIISDIIEQKSCNPTTELRFTWQILDITCDWALTIWFGKYQEL